MKTLKVLQGPFGNLCFTLYSIYFLYVLIGMEIYGGLIYDQQFSEMISLNPGDYAPDYIFLNFNDFLSGVITLFSMQLFNNWQFIWDQFNFTIDHFSISAVYFISFMILATYVLINILMAFVIDVYTSIEEAQKKEREERADFIQVGKLLLEEEQNEIKRRE